LITENEYQKIAEIGVFKAATLKRILGHNDLVKEYWAIDPWMQPSGDVIYKGACRFLPFYSQLRILRMTSVEASKLFKNKYLIDKRYFDLIFIDADHSYKAVKEDIISWIPHVKIGGMLCGHDYGGRKKGVKVAVDEMFGNDIELISDIWIRRIYE